MLLADMRKRIDEVDNELLRLLNKRASIVCDIAKMKAEMHMPFSDEARAQEIIKRTMARNSGPLIDGYIYFIFCQILLGCERAGKDAYKKANPPSTGTGDKQTFEGMKNVGYKFKFGTVAASSEAPPTDEPSTPA